ncbi:MAG: polysaccharide deacetylase family protein [bacterium]|nr:MAG: polysaccharide deacetylase family protein [bacterium]
MSESKNIPVFIYHDIVLKGRKSDLTLDILEDQFRFFKSNGYSTIFYDDLIKMLYNQQSFPKKTIVLTFDDGYLDNYVFLFPLLRKYNFRATIFVVTSWISDEQRTEVLTLQDYWYNKCELGDLVRGITKREALTRAATGDPSFFMTWDHLIEMEESGLVDIQSHSHTHKYFYSSDEIIDFVKVPDFTVFTATEGKMLLGAPVYKGSSALTVNRYSDDPSLREIIARDITKHHSITGDKNENLLKKIQDIANDYRKKKGRLGQHETDDQAAKRIRDELLISKELIENKLNKKCLHFSWPWGSYDKRSIKIAKECGYKSLRLFGIKKDWEGFCSNKTDPFFVKATYASHSIRILKLKLLLGENYPFLYRLYRKFFF